MGGQHQCIYTPPPKFLRKIMRKKSGKIQKQGEKSEKILEKYLQKFFLKKKKKNSLSPPSLSRKPLQCIYLSLFQLSYYCCWFILLNLFPQMDIGSSPRICMGSNLRGKKSHPTQALGILLLLLFNLCHTFTFKQYPSPFILCHPFNLLHIPSPLLLYCACARPHTHIYRHLT